MKFSCERCREIDREWRIESSAVADLAFRRRRRAIFHVKHCMTVEEQGEWLKAGGMRLIHSLGIEEGT